MHLTALLLSQLTPRCVGLSLLEVSTHQPKRLTANSLSGAHEQHFVLDVYLSLLFQVLQLQTDTRNFFVRQHKILHLS